MSTLKVESLRALADSKATKFLDSSGLSQGVLIKACCRWNSSGTAAIGHSFGVSSLTDNGVGNFTVTLSQGVKDQNGSSVGNAVPYVISSNSPVNSTGQPFHTVGFLDDNTNTALSVLTFNLNNSNLRGDPTKSVLMVAA